jgi:hypothetical protein
MSFYFVIHRMSYSIDLETGEDLQGVSATVWGLFAFPFRTALGQRLSGTKEGVADTFNGWQTGG